MKKLAVLAGILTIGLSSVALASNNNVNSPSIISVKLVPNNITTVPIAISPDKKIYDVYCNLAATVKVISKYGYNIEVSAGNKSGTLANKTGLYEVWLDNPKPNTSNSITITAFVPQGVTITPGVFPNSQPYTMRCFIEYVS